MTTTIKTYNKSLVWIIVSIAATGGLLFGFDIGVISGAIPYFQSKFKLDNGWVEIITSSGLAGAVIGAMFCGRITDILGRKKVILASAVIFAIGAIWSGLAPTVLDLVISRAFLGLAIGISSFAVPLYIAEISPTKIRGKLVSMFQLLVTIGVLVSYFSDLVFALPEGHPGYNECWRPMLYIGAVPAIILFTGMLFLPETPRWLISKGLEAKCYEVLQKVEDPALVEDVFNNMKAELQQDSGSWTDIFKPWLRTPFIVAVGIMFLQQFTGINTIIYYSPKIFLMAGFEGVQAAIMGSVSVGVVLVIFTIASLFMIDKLGRRKLFFIGLSGMVIALLAYNSVGAYLHFVFRNEPGPLGLAHHIRSFSFKSSGSGRQYWFAFELVI
jgi:sugar porter (SP) family MFS transporter